MKLKNILLINIISILLINNLLADSLEISLSNIKFNYKEYNNGKVLDSESSYFNNIHSYFNDIPGINIKYTKNIGKFIFNTNFEYNKGTTLYQGSTWSGVPLSFTENNVYLYNFNIINKYSLLKNNILHKKYNFYFLGGLGYRFWNRGTNGKDGDYNEQYKWLYYLLGAETNIQLNKKFIIGLQTYYQRAINPKMKAYLGSGVTYNLGTTSGYRISVPIKYKLKKNYGIVLRYTYDYWKINKSNIKYINILNSTTSNQYFNIGFYYNF